MNEITRTMRWHDYEQLVLQWGIARGIVQNGKPIGQAIKTLEEVTELLDAINKGDIEETKDAVGDIIVTLLMVCATSKIDFVDCLSGAYEQIKNRTGYLTSEGVFVKSVV